MKGNCNLFCSLLGGLFLSLSIVACGDESTSIEPTSDYDYLWNSEAGSLTFPCEKSREGNTAYAESENAVYVCKMEGDSWVWRVDSTIVPKAQSSSSSGKSSSSRKRGTSNPGKMIDITPYLNEDLEYGEFKDPRDGQTYKTIVIGDLEWFAQNLNYDYGDTTLNICMDFSQDSCAKYGRLYSRAGALDSLNYFSDDAKACEPYCDDYGHNWGEGAEPKKLQGVCPNGWRLSNNKDFFALKSYAEKVYHDMFWGSLLGARRGWRQINRYYGFNGYDYLGFSALPSGEFVEMNSWSSSLFSKDYFSAWSNAGGQSFTTKSSSTGGSSGAKMIWKPVRCVREVDWSKPQPKQPERPLLKGKVSDFLNPKVKYGEMTDERDGQKYKTVKIGEDTWMAQNLNYKLEESICGGGIEITDSEGDCNLFGRLYPWNTAVCPSGWHLPDSLEVEKLWDVATSGADSLPQAALRSVDGWKDDWKRTNETGFTALPAGYFGKDRDEKMVRYAPEFVAAYWMAKESSDKFAWRMVITAVVTLSGYRFLDTALKEEYLSVRCVKDR